MDGTYRTRTPAQTWQVIRPHLPSFGITRVADITGLDDLGIPVAQAVRPLARTLSVAQGKGATLEAARISAVMEAIEVWHAERAVPDPVERDAPATALGLPYQVTELESYAGALAGEHSRLEWIAASRLDGGGQVLVPAAAVWLGRSLHDDWRLHQPAASTNGLASGNTWAEACAHALCELVERDVLSRPVPGVQVIAPDTVTTPGCRAMLDRLAAAGAWIELRHLPNRSGVPVMTCHVWREDQEQAVFGGSGAHLDASVALSRAITEAAQSRLTAIAGAREDLPPFLYRPGPQQRPEPHAGPLTCWPTAVAAYPAPPADDDGHLRHLRRLTAAVTAAAAGPALAVQLTHGAFSREEFTVVKVIVPGLAYASRHTVPLLETP
ncbi:YcaO-like family protein [Streptomyces puniciscabiei]